jgi:hypothetical protein
MLNSLLVEIVKSAARVLSFLHNNYVAVILVSFLLLAVLIFVIRKHCKK